MTRSIFLILSAVLGLFTALAIAKDDRLRTYAFASKDCNGPPSGGNIDVKRDECMHIPGGALSIRTTAHKYQKWVQEVNKDQVHCEITTFTQYGCFQDYLDQSRDLPEAISDCIVATDQPILSVSFNCRVKAHEPKAKVVTKTSTWYEVGTATIWVSESNSFVSVHQPTTYTKTGEIISTVDTKSSTTHQLWIEPTPEPIWNEPATSTTSVTWSTPRVVQILVDPSAAAQTTVTMIVPSVDTMGVPTVITTTVAPVVTVTADTPPPTTVTMIVPPVNPSMKTITLRDVPSPATAPSHMDARPINPETDEETDDETDQNTHQLVARGKGKWKGPRKGVWMLHPWTLGLECYDCYTKSSTNTHKFECRSGPFNPIDCGEMPSSPTITNTVEVTPTVTLRLNEAPKHVLAKRKSWHRRVTFEHPWFPGTIMCADAEWEKRGQSKSEVRIQKPGETMKKCNKDDQLQDIGVHTATVTTYVAPKTIYTEDPSTLETVYSWTHTVYIEQAPTIITTIVGPPTSTVFIALSTSKATRTTTTIPPNTMSTVTVSVTASVTASTSTSIIYVGPPHADL